MIKKLLPVLIVFLVIAASCSSGDSTSQAVQISPSTVITSPGNTSPDATSPGVEEPPSTAATSADDLTEPSAPSIAEPLNTQPPSATQPPVTQPPATPTPTTSGDPFVNSIVQDQLVTRVTGNLGFDRTSAFQLSSVVDGTKPVLLWFWAPH